MSILERPSIYVICKCNWVSFAVSREYAIEQIKKFKEYFDTLSWTEQKEFYGGRTSTLSDYTCQFCGASEHFRKAEDHEIPFGSTVSPVIWEGK